MTAGGPVALLANRLRAGEKQFIAWCGIPEVTIPEALARDGYDAALLDMQHGAYDFLTAARGIAQVALAGKPTLVRIPVGQFATASRLLDYGAAGIVAPMVNSGDDARRFASFVKFPPMGDRSWGPRHALPLTGMDAATYLKEGNRNRDDRNAPGARRARRHTERAGIGRRAGRAVGFVDRADQRRDGRSASCRGGKGARACAGALQGA
jgi:hypothetical protein